jgi:PAS domain-containing protein
MQNRWTYEELKERVKELEKEAVGRSRADEALRESEVRLKTVLDTVQAGIFVIDPDRHVIVGANAAAGRTVGTPREEILYSLCHQYICPAEEGECSITDLGKNLDNVTDIAYGKRQEGTDPQNSGSCHTIRPRAFARKFLGYHGAQAGRGGVRATHWRTSRSTG